jgi:hypothetical protein
LFVPRKQGRRDVMQLKEDYIVEITKLVECVDRKEDPLIQIVRTHQHDINLAVLQTDSSRQKYERRKTNKGQHSG